MGRCSHNATLAPLGRYQPIEAWHVPIAGFSQGLADPTGTEILWQLLRAEHHNGCIAVMDPRAWNEDWEGVAEFIWRFRPPAGGPRIGVYAYSWGAGWGFVQLARALGRRGLRIEVAVLCDPVYRHRLRIKNWRVFRGDQTISVPASVDRVHWFYQQKNWPFGQKPVAADASRTSIWPGTELDAAHSWMDEHPDYHAAALWAAGRLTPRPCTETP